MKKIVHLLFWGLEIPLSFSLFIKRGKISMVADSKVNWSYAKELVMFLSENCWACYSSNIADGFIFHLWLDKNFIELFLCDYFPLSFLYFLPWRPLWFNLMLFIDLLTIWELLLLVMTTLEDLLKFKLHKSDLTLLILQLLVYFR